MPNTDGVGYTPGQGVNIAVDANNPDGALRQRVKVQQGVEGSASDIYSGNALPVFLDDTMLRRIVKLLECLATTDAMQRQRITIDAVGNADSVTALTGSLPTTVNSGTVTTVTNLTNFCGMLADEYYINIARQAAISQRAQLTFSPATVYPTS